MPVNKKSQQRIACLLRLMKEERYPNFPMVLKELRRLDEAGVYKLSQKTIQRDVKYLVEELHAPIQYDAERKGYYLTDRFWSGVPITEEVEMDAAVYGAHLAETLLPLKDMPVTRATVFDHDGSLQAPGFEHGLEDIRRHFLR